MTSEQPIAMPPPSILLAMVDLADCVCAELSNTGAGPTCWCGLYPGASVSWEYCGECSGGHCGMGWVRLSRVFPYTVFPNPEIDVRCQLPLAWELEVGALRCVSTPGNGEPPSAQDMGEAATMQVLDGRALWCAIRGCGYDVAAGMYVPVGPMGACVGGYWSAWMPIDNY